MTANAMAMLPNDKHPGPGCSCADCLRAYPEQPTSNTCAECGGPFGSHYGDCRIATGMKPKPTSKTKVYDVDLRNTRAWAAARIGTMSGASTIVAACDEALAARERAPAEPAEGRIEPKMDDETVILRRMLGAAQARIMELERAPQPPSEWQPIETAPKDGTKILLGYFPEPAYEGASVGESQEVAFWHGTHQKWCGRTLLNAEGYFSPTHWRPLPPSPRLPPTKEAILDRAVADVEAGIQVAAAFKRRGQAGE